MPTRLQPSSFDEITGWNSDNHDQAFAAFLVSANRMTNQPYKTRGLGVDGEKLSRLGKLALSKVDAGSFSPKECFEENFVPHKVCATDTIDDPQSGGFVTGFFEPVKKASRMKTPHYSVPLYTRPPDLIDVDDTNRPSSMSSCFRFGRNTKTGIEPYLDRAAIQGGALENQGLELVWLADKTDVFFIHVQGAAKLKFDDGTLMRVTFSAKTGHSYTSVAKVLCRQIGTTPQDMTADKLAEWMRSHPDKIDDLLAHNESYIFFEETRGLSADNGPVAAAKTPLIAGRSLAVDRTLHTFGTPVWLETDQPLPGDQKPFGRLLMAHDTGSAIVGAARGDIFVGSGEEAGLKAGRIRHAATMTVLVPKP